MQPKSNRSRTVLWSTVAIAICAAFAAFMGVSPWLVVFLVVGMAVMIWLAAANGLSGNP